VTDEQKKGGAAFWLTVAMVAALIAYPVLFGPACYLCEKNLLSQKVAWVMFRPMTWLARTGPAPVSRLIAGYAELCGDQRRLVAYWFDGWRRMRDSVSPIDYEFARETE
jgi:hypothetical protein